MFGGRPAGYPHMPSRAPPGGDPKEHADDGEAATPRELLIDQGVGMLKKQVFQIVPVKRAKTLDPEEVSQIAESILEEGQTTPVLVRADGDRFVLVEG